MNKLLSIVVLLAVAVCSCHGILDRRNIRSAGSEVSGNVDPVNVDTIAPRDLETADTNDVFTARVKKGGNKNKEMLHMGLSFVKMILGTLTAAIGHVFAFKSVGLSLISVLIQIAQFIMVLKKNKDSQPPSYKIVETPWHTSPTESYGAYGSYAGHAKSAAAVGGYNASPYAAAAPPRRRR